MDKNEQIIMTVPVKELFKDKYFNGFSYAKAYDYEKIISSRAEWTKRGIAETDFTRKQPIGYGLVTNLSTKELFVYQRAGDKNYDESRLRGKFSFGFGGHIEKDKTNGQEIVKNTLLRELDEELIIPEKPNFSVLGFINDDSDEVGKVHFGMLYLADVKTKDIKLRGIEASYGEMISFSKIENMLKSKDIVIESWSKIAYGALMGTI